jgi:hypothetical protein
MQWKTLIVVILWVLPMVYPSAFAVYFHIYQEEWSQSICLEKDRVNNCCQAKCQWEKKSGMATSNSKETRETPWVQLFQIESIEAGTMAKFLPELPVIDLEVSIGTHSLSDPWSPMTWHPPEIG